jgi:hypothetical protein
MARLHGEETMKIFELKAVGRVKAFSRLLGESTDASGSL